MKKLTCLHIQTEVARVCQVFPTQVVASPHGSLQASFRKRSKKEDVYQRSPQTRSVASFSHGLS